MDYTIYGQYRQVYFTQLSGTFGERALQKHRHKLKGRNGRVCLIFSLDRFSNKAKESLKSPRKAYAYDLGIINSIKFKISPDIGRLLENFVAIGFAFRCTGRASNLANLGISYDYQSVKKSRALSARTSPLFEFHQKMACFYHSPK